MNKIANWILALICAAALGISGCGTDVRADGAADGESDTEADVGGESRSPENNGGNADLSDQEDTARDITDDIAGNLVGNFAENPNRFLSDEDDMALIKYNIYVKLSNTVAEVLDNVTNYFLVVDTAEEFQIREDAEYSYGYGIAGLDTAILEDAEAIYMAEPFFETLDALAENMLPAMREVMETFNAIHESEHTYGQNEYEPAGEYHAQLMECLKDFTDYAYAFVEEVDRIADERSAKEEERMLAEGRIIIYNFSHMLTVSSRILDEIYEQGIDDYNLTELDLEPIYPMLEELRTTAAAYDEAVSDSSRLKEEALSGSQVYAGQWSSLLEAYECMIRQVESGTVSETPSQEYLGGLQHIYVVLSGLVDDYNEIFVE